MKMLWRPCVNFTNNLQAAFAPIFFYQKNTNPNCIHREATQNIFVQKSYLQNVDEIDTFSQSPIPASLPFERDLSWMRKKGPCVFFFEGGMEWW